MPEANLDRTIEALVALCKPTPPGQTDPFDYFRANADEIDKAFHFLDSYFFGLGHVVLEVEKNGTRSPRYARWRNGLVDDEAKVALDAIVAQPQEMIAFVKMVLPKPLPPESKEVPPLLGLRMMTTWFREHEKQLNEIRKFVAANPALTEKLLKVAAAANGSKWGISWSLIKDPELAAFVWQHYGTLSNLDEVFNSDFTPKDKKDIEYIVGELFPAIRQGNSPLQNLQKALNYQGIKRLFAGAEDPELEQRPLETPPPKRRGRVGTAFPLVAAGVMLETEIDRRALLPFASGKRRGCPQ